MQSPLVGSILIVAIASTAYAGSIESSFIQNTRQLTFDGTRAGEGYFSNDGQSLIFQSERDASNPFYQIYVVSLTTGDTHRVSSGTGKTTCAYFHPDGKRVLFASTHLDPRAVEKQEEELAFRASGKERRYAWDYDSAFDIFSAAVTGKDARRLTTSDGYDAEGAFSPDGKRIVFCSMRDAFPADRLSGPDRERLELDPSYFGEIYIMDADGANQRRLTEWPGYDGGPFFTPDGERIVWRHFTEDGAIADVYTMNLDGADRQRLTDFGSMCWAPFFHPSGEYAIFTTNKLGFSNFELYVVDRAGLRDPVRVTDTDGFDGLPVFSPDGTRIAWTSNRTSDGKSQLFIATWNHAAALDAIRKSAHRERAGLFAPTIDHALPHSERVAGYTTASAETADAGTPAATIRAHVGVLAADDMEGRMTGSKGERAAGEYIARTLAGAGLEPLGTDGTWFQEFPFTSGVSVNVAGCSMELKDGHGQRAFAVSIDFRPLAFSENASVGGEVVFAGYGLTVPGDSRDAYNSYAGLDVKDKVVLVLRYAPEDVGTERRAELNRYAGLRYKAMLAREAGAKALLIAIGPNSPNAGELTPLGFDQALAGSGIPVAAITGDVAEMLFAGYEQSLAEVQDGLDAENPHVAGAFVLPGVTVTLSTSIQRDTGTGRNVIGYIPPRNASIADTPIIVIGAHYDHIGHGDIGSLARKGEENMIHNGADDNASGTAVVLELAAALSRTRASAPEKFNAGVVVALWSGEELGIIGSNFWTDHPTVDKTRIAAYLNFDMVGRLRDNTLMLQGIGSSDVWKGIIEKRNVPAGFNLKLLDDPYLPTDVTAFYPKGIPVMSWFTGSHEDYNRPTDDTETLNYEGMERIGAFALAVAMDLAVASERPTYVAVERSREDTGSRASLRAYLGTIPDYATGDQEGVKLSGVRGGGPADKAGLRGGDIIVEFAGRAIKNIYDYTYALDAVKVGEPLEVVVLRDGERVALTVIPEARK